MLNVSESFAIAALFAVIAVLVIGFLSMVDGHKGDAHEGERLMAWRLGFQAVAVGLLIAGAVFVF